MNVPQDWKMHVDLVEDLQLQLHHGFFHNSLMFIGIQPKHSHIFPLIVEKTSPPIF